MNNILEATFSKPIKKLFFVGIGGSSMSGLAGIAKEQGFEVEGSDMVESPYTERLIKSGIPVHIGHTDHNIPEGTDLVIYSAAIHADNPDMQRAEELCIPKVERSEYLGLLSRACPKTICIAGTHGKTTTSSMVASILHHGGLDPSVSIGGRLDEIGGNACLGSSDYFVIESCEFVDSFLKTRHKIGVITNIEEDHLDYFKGGLPQIMDFFHRFGMILPEDGYMVAYGDQPEVREVCQGLRCPVVYYGLGEDNDWNARNIRYDSLGNPTFEAWHGDELVDDFSLKVPGQHNVLDALAAIAVGDYVGVNPDIIQESLNTFGGAHRRFEFRGEVNGISVYEDYAHHPTELKVVIDACMNHEHNELWVVFQPHTYSRTKLLFDEFVDAFEKADKIILNDIYSDREGNEEWQIYSEDLAKIIKEKYKKPTIVMSEFEDIVKFLTDNLHKDDLVLVAGSQTINKVAYMLVDALKEKYGE